MTGILTSALLAAMLSSPLETVAGSQGAASQDAAPKILLDQSPRAVEYQLSRLTNDELSRVERQPTDAKYRPIYYALLTRKGLARPLRDEALAALVKMDNTSQSQVVLQALGKIQADTDKPGGDQAGDQLLEILLGQSAEMLRGQRPRAPQTYSQS